MLNHGIVHRRWSSHHGEIQVLLPWSCYLLCLKLSSECPLDWDGLMYKLEYKEGAAEAAHLFIMLNHGIVHRRWSSHHGEIQVLLPWYCYLLCLKFSSECPLDWDGFMYKLEYKEGAVAAAHLFIMGTYSRENRLSSNHHMDFRSIWLGSCYLLCLNFSS